VYAIIEDSGQQFKVSEGDVLRVDLRDLAEGVETLEFPRVLLVSDGKTLKVGTPLVEGAKVVASIEEELAAGPKVRTFKYKRRKGYRKRIGHRQKYIEVKVTQIVA
jgi:large subunit ribosomal protein L21